MTNTAKILNFCRGNFAKQERNGRFSMMVTPDYQICCLRLIQAQI